MWKIHDQTNTSRCQNTIKRRKTAGFSLRQGNSPWPSTFDSKHGTLAGLQRGKQHVLPVKTLAAKVAHLLVQARLSVHKNCCPSSSAHSTPDTQRTTAIRVVRCHRTLPEKRPASLNARYIPRLRGTGLASRKAMDQLWFGFISPTGTLE